MPVHHPQQFVTREDRFATERIRDCRRSEPSAIAITPDGKVAYVVNQGSGTVTPIRTATNTAAADPGSTRS